MPAAAHTSCLPAASWQCLFRTDPVARARVLSHSVFEPCTAANATRGATDLLLSTALGWDAPVSAWVVDLYLEVLAHLDAFPLF